MGAEIKLKVDTKPLLLYLEVFKRILQISNSSINFSDFSSEIVRFETDNSTASAGEISITLYPSDTFIRFVSALWTSDGNF